MGRSTDEPGFEPLARGASIGRYVVLGLLGRGGMGEVYAAFDPELDRKVAVKLLRERIENGVSLAEGRQRTLREAQAIARLAHPNVVVVYDVGTFREQVFIAMEFVDGHTASYWVQAQPRTWQEVLKVYLAAGRGLAAAHEKGLVHRDFKPENVMVARDGEVRVMDFGLAREIDARATRNGPVTTTTAKFGDVRTDGGTIVLHKPRPDGPSRNVGAVPVSLNNDDGVVQEMRDTDPSAAGDLFSARLTKTGAIMGTPAYMAPEQFFKSGTDARSDQFSFCVTLYEALYGERPFPGNNIQTLVGNIVQGNIREPPAGSKVPYWVRKVLLRGLRPTAAERYPAMADILGALQKDPRVRYRRIALGVTLALVPLALGLGVRPLLAERRPVCTNGADKLAAIWDVSAAERPEAPAQRRIHESFLRSGKTYAADVYETVRRALTNYTNQWSEMYKETCEATQVRHEQSPEVLDLRMSCLNDRLGELRALTNVLQNANGEVVENAANATNALPSLDRCADLATLRAVIKPPDDAVARAKVNDLRQRLADLKARFDAGAWKEGQTEAPKLVSMARAIGYQPLLAEALNLSGHVFSEWKNSAAAEADLTEAYALADASRHDEVRAEAARTLVYVTGYENKKFSEAFRWFNVASAVIQRLGGHDLLRAWLLNDLACAYVADRKVDEGMRAMKEALSIKQRLLGSDSFDLSRSEGNVAYILGTAGRYDEALLHAERSISIGEKRLGPDHPLLAEELSNRGEILNGLGRYQEAQKTFLRAKRILEREFGSEADGIATALTGLGNSYLGESKFADALAVLERAMDLRNRRDADPAAKAQTMFALARALWEAGREMPRARRLAAQARESFARAEMGRELDAVDDWLVNHRST